MKRVLKALLAALVIFALLAALTGCSKSIVGTWTLTGAEGIETTGEGLALNALGGVVEFTFTADEMTRHVAIGDQTQDETAAYDLKDGKIIDENGLEIEYSIEGKKLRLKVEEQVLVFTRK